MRVHLALSGESQMFFFDPTYLILVFLPTLVITGLAQAWVKGAYQK